MDTIRAITGPARRRISYDIAGLVFLLGCVSPLRAQTFIEGGGGWTYMQQSASHGGYNLRAAIGRAITPRVRVRVDAFMIQFNDKIPITQYQSCASLNCASVQDQTLFDGKVSGVAATALLNIDRRGVIYVVGGVSYLFANEGTLGLTVGAGLTAPVGVHLRVFAETRWMTFSTRYLAPRAVQLTAGLRYGL